MREEREPTKRVAWPVKDEWVAEKNEADLVTLG